MRNLVKEAFSLHLFILQVVGLLPIENYEKYFKFYAIPPYIILRVGFPISSLLFYYKGELDVERFASSALISLELTTFIFKFYPFVRNGPKIMDTIKMLERPIFSNNFKERQSHILDYCNMICKRCCWYFLMNVCLSAPIYSTLPIIMKNNLTPTELWLPFDHSKGTKLFNVVYIYCCVCVVMAAFSTATYDTLVAGLVYQATAQFRILKDNLQNLKSDVEDDIINFFPNMKNKEKLKEMLIYDKIKKYVGHHQEILKFVDAYEYHFTSGVFAQFLGGCLVVCISVFELTIVQPFSFAFIFACIYTISVLFELFLFCYFGTTLTYESKSLVTAIYMGHWYEYDLKSRKLLLILMEKSNKSLMVTAGNILDLSLDTFTMIIRRAYSFYAVLRRYQESM